MYIYGLNKFGHVNSKEIADLNEISLLCSAIAEDKYKYLLIQDEYSLVDVCEEDEEDPETLWIDLEKEDLHSVKETRLILQAQQIELAEKNEDEILEALLSLQWALSD